MAGDDDLEAAFANLSVGSGQTSAKQQDSRAQQAKSQEDDGGLEDAFGKLSMQNDSEDTQLVKALREFGEEAKASKTNRKANNLLRSTVHHVVDAETQMTHDIESWKMSDWEYKKDPCPFPTRARGLFTEKMPDGQYRIAARGYNKFFNINEVSWTKWDALQKRTKGPYYLTVKSNGCIILIAALSPKTILVTSKHSIGGMNDRDQSHAQRGEQRLEEHLKRIGKSKAQLAAHLWEHKLTAVAELCDDAFEEHVLGYSPETTGLHLHGLNHNSRHLLTYPPDEVAAFARKWGFIQTAYETFSSVDEVKRFTDECGKDGRWNCEWVEGFVVRATATEAGNFNEEEQRLRAFMWKVKFEEPYLTWRDWREKTRHMLSNKKKGVKASSQVVSNGKSSRGRRAIGAGAGQELYGVNVERIQKLETRLYVRWCARMIDEEPEWFESFGEGRGIIAVRDRFIEWLGTEEGKEALKNKGLDWQSLAEEHTERAQGDGLQEDDGVEYDKTLIVPIAIPGCGKTTMALALTELFQWGHTQSDDINTKKKGPQFIANVKKLLEDDEHKVIIADKNNHCKQHREDLARIVHELKPKLNIRMIALVWDVEGEPQDKIARICSERIGDRGERHQSLRPSDTDIDNVLAMFFSQRDDFDPVSNGSSDGHFHGEIVVSIDLTPKDMLDEIIDRLIEAKIVATNPHAPTRKARDRAIEHAMDYKPTVHREAQASPKPKAKAANSSPKHKRKSDAKPRYYGIVMEVDLRKLVPKHISLPRDVKRDPHLTIVHSAELPGRKTAWDSAIDAVDEEVEVTLGPKMAMIADRVASLEASYEPAFLIEGADGRHMHATVATGDAVKAVEGKQIWDALRSGKDSLDGRKIEVVDIGERRIKGVVRGLFQ